MKKIPCPPCLLKDGARNPHFEGYFEFEERESDNESISSTGEKEKKASSPNFTRYSTQQQPFGLNGNLKLRKFSNDKRKQNNMPVKPERGRNPERKQQQQKIPEENSQKVLETISDTRLTKRSRSSSVKYRKKKFTKLLDVESPIHFFLKVCHVSCPLDIQFFPENDTVSLTADNERELNENYERLTEFLKTLPKKYLFNHKRKKVQDLITEKMRIHDYVNKIVYDYKETGYIIAWDNTLLHEFCNIFRTISFELGDINRLQSFELKIQNKLIIEKTDKKLEMFGLRKSSVWNYVEKYKSEFTYNCSDEMIFKYLRNVLYGKTEKIYGSTSFNEELNQIIITNVLETDSLETKLKNIEKKMQYFKFHIEEIGNTLTK